MNLIKQVTRTIVVLAAVLSCTVQGQDTRVEGFVKLGWDASKAVIVYGTNGAGTIVPDTNGVVIGGYYIYYGMASGQYTNKVGPFECRTGSVTGLVAGTSGSPVKYYFAATAFRRSDKVESSFSNEVTYTVTNAPGPITNVVNEFFAPGNLGIIQAGLTVVTNKPQPPPPPEPCSSVVLLAQNTTSSGNSFAFRSASMKYIATASLSDSLVQEEICKLDFELVREGNLRGNLYAGYYTGWRPQIPAGAIDSYPVDVTTLATGTTNIVSFKLKVLGESQPQGGTNWVVLRGNELTGQSTLNCLQWMRNSKWSRYGANSFMGIYTSTDGTNWVADTVNRRGLFRVWGNFVGQGNGD